ncbi:MAG: alpha/beta fold hydrolase [Candidatus Nanohaloarchaea archaeon]|nr:alpha/beta fold hydrolase [Candidatus Nanohaloarchaea archaeon]
MESTNVQFENSREMTLKGIIDHPDGADHDDPSHDLPAAVLCHSFTGFKEIPHLEALAEELTDRGMVALRFDFSDCVGESDGSCEDMKLTNQLDDLENALSFLEAMGEVDEDRLGVAGHSLGGMTAILVAARDGRPDAVVPVAAPANHEGEKLFEGKELDRWKEMGHTHFPTVKRGEVKIGWAFYEDLQQYDAVDVVGDIDAPLRFVHGDADDIVPLANSEMLYEAASEPKDLHVVEGADHLFRRDEHEDAMVAAVADWMEQHV